MTHEPQTPDRGNSPERATPAATPAASNHAPSQPPVFRTPLPFLAGKSSATPGGEGTLRRRTTKLAVLALRRSMPDRDLAILESVAAHRFLTTRHITALHFADHAQGPSGSRTARQVLQRLDEGGVLSHLEQRVGGVRAGADGYIWRVGTVGDGLLRLGREDTITRIRRFEPSTWFLAHCLAVADARVTVLQAARAGSYEVVRLEIEPTTWRHYLGTMSERRVLKPDLSVVTASGDYEDHYWLEVDLGTEHVPTLIKKCREYQYYRRTGAEEAYRGPGIFPVVVWIMHSVKRAMQLQEAIVAARGLDATLFRVITLEGLPDLLAGGAA